MKNELNKYGIFILDVFVINYCGIIVFFQVCKTTEKSVFLVEMGTKRYKDGITLTKRYKPSRCPYVITKNNTFRKSTYEVYPVKLENDYWLPIVVDYGSPLYRSALMETEYPPTGTFFAVPVRDYTDKYWKRPEPKKSKKLLD